MLAFAGLSSGTYVYAHEIEPEILDIMRVTIHSKKISPAFNNFKILQFSDTHIGFHYSIEDLNRLVQTINAQEADIIVFTGDLIDEPNNFYTYPEVVESLNRLKANYGKFWIYGNHDHGGYGTEIIKDTMEKSDFTLLQNEHIPVERNGSHFILAGLDDVILGDPDIPTALEAVTPELFTILMVHEPDYADQTVRFPVDLQLSGHSHGGQVRIPLIGDIYTPSYAEKYVQGKYVLGNGKLTLFVNTGIGTTRLPYRFLCRPELHVYTLQSNN